MLVFFWIQPVAFNSGKAQWENLGDAHFYAASAKHWQLTGEQRWFELYPVALRKNSGLDMGFSAPAHYILAAHFLRFGTSAPEAVLLLSSLSISLLASLFFVLGCHIWKFPALGWAMGLSLGLCPSLWDFSTSGGSDALGLLFFCSALLSLYCFSKTSLLRYWIMGLIWAVAAALTRPQGQLLLWICPLLLWGSPRQSILKLFPIWLGALLTLKLLQNQLLEEQKLVFPYAFSFLVGTSPWPGHALFREYFSGGFGLPQVWEYRHLWPEKIHCGLNLLKQYWDSWLIPGAVFGLGAISPKTRRLSLMMGLILCGLLFLSACGHRVPRYWTFMGAPAFLVAWIWAKPLLFNWQRQRWSWCLPLFFLLALGVDHSPWLTLPHERNLNICQIPIEIQKKIESCDWLATDRPALVIDAFKKPILLLPNRVQQLNDIHKDVHPLPAILLSPHIGNGEQSQWKLEKQQLGALGWTCVLNLEGWELYLWLKPHFSEAGCNSQVGIGMGNPAARWCPPPPRAAEKAAQSNSL